MGKLTLHLEGRNLPNKDRFGKSDPYVSVFVVTVNGGLKFVGKTEDVKNNLNPDWKPLVLDDPDIDITNDNLILNIQVGIKSNGYWLGAIDILCYHFLALLRPCMMSINSASSVSYTHLTLPTILLV